MSEEPGMRLRMGVATWVRYIAFTGESVVLRIIPIEVYRGERGWMLRAWSFDDQREAVFDLDGFVDMRGGRPEAHSAPGGPTARMIAEVDDTA